MSRDLERVIDAVLDGVIVLDARGHVEHLNTEASRLLETSISTARGTPVELLVGSEHPLARLARTVLDSGRSAVENEQGVARRFEPDVVVDVAASPLFDEEGTVSGAVLALRDRTIHRSLEQEVAQQQRLETFGRIAAGIAHEVKNPLGGIRGAAEILASRTTDPKTLDAAELVVREVDRIAALVDELMVFARGDQLRLARTNVHQVLDDVLDLLVMDPLARGVEVVRSFDPSIPDLEADADRLTQVFLNLARNALQAMESSGGKLEISTRMTLEHRIVGKSGHHLPTLMIEIRDNGPGMPPEVLEKSATPLFTTRVGGHGLGLALSRHWVRRHDGKLRIQSQPGQGTTVRVTLPLRREP